MEVDLLVRREPRLLDCKLIALPGENLQQWVHSMHDQLYDTLMTFSENDCVDACLIELQPSLNPKAVALSHALHMMFSFFSFFWVGELFITRLQ